MAENCRELHAPIASERKIQIHSGEFPSGRASSMMKRGKQLGVPKQYRAVAETFHERCNQRFDQQRRQGDGGDQPTRQACAEAESDLKHQGHQKRNRADAETAEQIARQS